MIIIDPRKPTAAQAIFDALEEGSYTSQELARICGIGYSQVRRALATMKGNIECTKGPFYSLSPVAKRPSDRRGRKPPRE